MTRRGIIYQENKIPQVKYNSAPMIKTSEIKLNRAASREKSVFKHIEDQDAQSDQGIRFLLAKLFDRIYHHLA